MSDNTKTIILDDKEITIIGTAHVSSQSAEEVERVIREIRPDSICIELDSERYSSLENNTKWKDTDIIDVIKQKRTTLMLVNLILAGYQKRLAESFGINSGQEMINAINLSKELGAELVLADRNIKTTFQRIFRNLSMWEKSKLMAGLVLSFFDDEEITDEDLENLKEGDFIENALKDIGAEYPELKKYLVDERDIYLSQKIRNATGKKIVAVIGKAHMNGVISHINEEIDTDYMDVVPKKRSAAKFIAYLIPAIIIILVGFSFYQSMNSGMEQIKTWILYNGTLSALGTLLAFGSVPSIITAFVMAPLTSLNPLLAAGWFAGLMEAHVRKPKVRDIENISEDLDRISGLWKNRITRTLLVVTFANIGSSIGTFLAGANIIKNIINMF